MYKPDGWRKAAAKHRELSQVLCDDRDGGGGGGGRGTQEEGTCITMADACCCIAETNITL